MRLFIDGIFEFTVERPDLFARRLIVHTSADIKQWALCASEQIEELLALFLPRCVFLVVLQPIPLDLYAAGIGPFSFGRPSGNQ